MAVSAQEVSAGGGIVGNVAPAERQVDPDKITLTDDMQKVFGSELSDTRKAAEGWRTGLGSLLALFAVVVTFKAKDSFHDFVSWWSWIVLAVSAAALAAGAVGAGYSLSAANGRPTVVTRLTIDAVGGIDGWNLKKSQRAVDDLRIGRRLAYATFGLAAIALGMTITGPAATPATPMAAKVTLPVTGEVVCGVLKPSGVGTVTVQVGDTSRTFTVSQLAAMTVVAKC